MKRAGDVLVYQNGGTGYTPRSSITMGTELIDKWKIYVELCFKNGHKTISIPPYKSETKTLELERVIGYTKSKSSNFKIGFHFVPPPEQLKNIPIKLEKLKPNDLTIWSNTVSTNYFSKH